MHCKLDFRVENTRVLKLCPAKRIDIEQTVAFGTFASLKPSVVAAALRCLNRYGIAKRTRLSPAEHRQDGLVWQLGNSIDGVLIQDMTPSPGRRVRK